MNRQKPETSDPVDSSRAFCKAAEKIRAIDQAARIAEASAIRGRDKIALLVIVLVMAGGWYNTFNEMWHRWFEAWHQVSWPLMDRIAKGDSYYTHGPLVPLVSLIAVIFIYKRIGMPVARTASSKVTGGLLLAVMVVGQLFAARAGVMFVSGFALLGIIAALVLLWGGWPLARAYWLPVVILVFMVPLPMDAIAKLNYQLKYFAAAQALQLTNVGLGIPAVMDGAYVYLEPGPDGVPKTLVVENVCGGLRSLISLIFFASLFAVVCRLKGLWRWGMLLVAVPVAVAANVVRITSMNVVAHHYGVAAAGADSDFHAWSGIGVFAIALAILVGLERGIMLLCKWLKRDWIDNRLLGFLNDLPKPPPGPPRIYQPLTIGVLACTAALSIFWTVEDPRFNASRQAVAAVPRSVQIGATPFDSTDSSLDELVLAILQTDDYLYRHFRGSQERFDILVVFSPNNRKGTHPPEVCIEGSGKHIVSKQTIEIDALPHRSPLRMRELIAQKDDIQTYHAYVYKCGDSYTSSYLKQQFLIFVNGLIDRNSAGALIRFDVPIRSGDVVSARQMALDAVFALMPGIDDKLP